jgi:hypothetical protein
MVVSPSSVQPRELKNFELHQTARLRFQNATNATATAITWQNLLDTWVFASTATIGYQLFDFVRIIKIEMWAITNSTLVTTLGVDFGDAVTGVQGDGGSYQSCSVGSAIPAYLKCRPNPNSQAAQFQTTKVDTAFHIRTNGAVGSTIVELTLEFKNSTVLNPSFATNALVAATAGDIYFRGMDGKAIAATAWLSLLLPNTN